MTTNIYKTSRMLRKSRDILRKHPVHLLLPLILRFGIRAMIGIGISGIEQMGSFSSLRGIWFGGSLNILALLWALLQLILLSGVAAYTMLRFASYLQGHTFSTKVLLTKMLKKWPRFFMLSLIQSLIIILPLYLSFLLLSYHLWRGAVLGVAGGLMSIGLVCYLIFIKYIYLLEGGNCPSVIKSSWTLVKRIGRRKIANKIVGIIGMMILISLVYGVFVLPLFSVFLPGSEAILSPLFTGFLSVWTLGAWIETYLTYKEKLPGKKEDTPNTSFWIITVVIGILYLFAAWILLMMSSLTSMFLRYGTTTTKRELPHQTFTQEQQANAEKNITTISTLFTDKQATKTLFSQDDINAMIATVTGAQDVLRARLQDNLLYLDFSFGLSKIPQKQFIGKYLYGTLGFKLQQSSQSFQPIEILLMTGSINGKTLPVNVMEQIKGKNIAEGMYQSSDAKVQAILDRIKTIEIKNNKLSIETKE